MISRFAPLCVAATRGARRAPRALLWLWAGQLCFGAAALLVFRAALGDAWAHRPAPSLLDLGSLALRESGALLPMSIAVGAVVLLYALASPLLHAVVLQRLGRVRLELPSTQQVAVSVLKVTLLFTLARAAVVLAWLLTWPGVLRLSQTIADERWQLLLLGAFVVAGLLLWSLLSLLLRHTIAALALGLAHDASSASRLVARVYHDASRAMWACWALERGLWLGTLLLGLALHMPTLPLTWGVALLLEVLVVTRLVARIWALVATMEVLPAPSSSADAL
ncbi:MAG: hypothetical protein JRH20_20650 [Deltaproteobacteria bacterium]|nr:hypothetical protein [Deltaproteobacteria bacterium]